MSQIPAAKSPRLRAPLVGRERELEMLEAALADTLQSRAPNMVTLSGAAGVGKTRLLREFLTNVRMREEGPRVFTVMSRQHGAADAPIRALLRERLGIAEAASAEETEVRFRGAVTSVIGETSSADFLHFLGRFLGLDLPESPLVRAVGGDLVQSRQVQRAVLRQFLELDARKRPLLIAFENFQWAHESALELLAQLAGTLREAPILLVFVTRPELLQRAVDWARGPNHLRFDLGPLPPDEAAEMFRYLLAPAGEPPEDLMDAAIDLANGSPYLMEQLVRAFIEQGVVVPQEAGAWSLHPERLDEERLPLTVDDAIEARIADLGVEERALLEMAAVLGGVFWLGALLALERLSQAVPSQWFGSASDRGRLEELLADLIERDYLLRMPDSTIAGEPEYAFKHNLEREALQRHASTGLLQQYHMRIGQWLECRLSDRDEEHCELLAQHYEQGGARELAARYYLRAAELARQRFASMRACDYFKRGLRLLSGVVSRDRLHGLDHFSEVLHQARRTGDALAALSQAKELAFLLDLPEAAGRASLRAGRVYRDEGRLEDAQEELAAACALFEACNSVPGIADAMTTQAQVQMLRGNFGAAEQIVSDIRARLVDLGERGPQLARSQISLGSLCRAARRFDEADAAFAMALANFRSVGDPHGEAEALCLRGMVASQTGREEQAERLWQESLAVARASGDRFQEVLALTCLGSASYRAGRAEAAVPLLTEAARLSATLGDRLQEADTLRSLAKAKTLSGDPAGGFADAEAAVATFERAGSLPQLAVALRTLGEIAAGHDWDDKPEVDAAALFERSIELFEQLGGAVEKARSCFALAEHLRARGAMEDSHRAGELELLARSLIGDEPRASLPPGMLEVTARDVLS